MVSCYPLAHISHVFGECLFWIVCEPRAKGLERNLRLSFTPTIAVSVLHWYVWWVILLCIREARNTTPDSNRLSVVNIYLKSALFSCWNEKNSATVALSFVCDKYYLIMYKLDSKYLFRNLQINCVISFCFWLYLILYACATRFDVTGNLEKFFIFWGELNKAII